MTGAILVHQIKELAVFLFLDPLEIYYLFANTVFLFVCLFVCLIGLKIWWVIHFVCKWGPVIVSFELESH